MTGGGNHSPLGQTNRQTRHIRARQRRHEAVVGVRRRAERVLAHVLLRRVVQEAQVGMALVGEVGREEILRHVQRHCERRQHAVAHRAQGAEIGRHVRPQFGHAFGPLVLTTQRNAGEHVRMIRPTIMADKEALILVGLRRLVHLRCSLHRCVHRHVADIVLVQPKLQLLFERQCMETSRCGEAAIDDLLRHAMVEA